ncbi:hypothetical protein [Plantactinospora sp. WMMB782]|uniref:hypothetical protein n=1 Tax=Plantactinospora sp. WMMB782 TaxID=3404121 RepID=UPI003B95C92B
MSRLARRPPELRGRIFRGSQAVARGLLTKNDLRSSAWRPLFRGIYADVELAVPHHTRCAVVARWLLPAGAAIAGRSAAVLYGVPSLTEPDAPVEVLVPAGTRLGPMAGLRVHTGTLTPGDVRSRRGIPVTIPGRTCWDLACWLDLVEAVSFWERVATRRA